MSAFMLLLRFLRSGYRRLAVGVLDRRASLRPCGDRQPFEVRGETIEVGVPAGPAADRTRRHAPSMRQPEDGATGIGLELVSHHRDIESGLDPFVFEHTRRVP